MARKKKEAEAKTPVQVAAEQQSDMTDKVTPPELTSEDMAFTSRSKAIDEIAAKRSEALASESEPIPGTADETEPELTLDEAAKAAETAAAKEPKTPTAIPATTPTSEQETLVVDGVEVQIGKDKIFDAGRRALQKDYAADHRLAEANRIHQEAITLLTKLKPNVPLPPSSPGGAGAVPASTDASQMPSDADAVALTKSLLYGEEKDAVAAVQKILGYGRQAAQALATQARGMEPANMTSLVRETIAYENAMSKFKGSPQDGGFGDLWADENLRKLVIDRERHYRDQLKDSRPYWDLFDHIGKEVRSWRDGLAKPVVPSQTLQNREDLKRSSSVVRAAGGRVPTPPAGGEAKVETRAEYLDRQRQARRLS